MAVRGREVIPVKAHPMLQVLLALTWYLLLPVAAQAAAGNPKMAEMSMREMILERDRALQGFAGQAIPEVSGDLGRTEEIASGTVFFYGEVPVKVGLRDIDWSGGHLKHQEWPAQLNRFGYLRQLASAYRATHDERFATAARAYIEDWIRSNPGYDRFRPSDSSLNMSIRLGTSVASGWAGVLPVFLDSPAFNDEFLKTMMVSISSQARFLSRHLTPRANWRISELDALVFTALRLPFLENAAGAARHRRRGPAQCLRHPVSARRRARRANAELPRLDGERGRQLLRPGEALPGGRCSR